MPVRYQIAGRGSAEISASAEAAVRAGRLGPGALLPPVRRLAADLGVAPATVAAAYRILRQRGVVETAGRNGTRVRARPPVASPRSVRLTPPPGTVDLASGEPDPRLLPALAPRLRRLATSAVKPVPYTTSGPWPELVELARHQFAADGLPVASASITVTSGALDAIERLLTTHTQPGDRIGIEDPGWANLIDLCAVLGLEAVALPVDDDGPTIDGLRRAVQLGIAAAVVTCRAHNPTGAAVTPARARALAEVLATAPGLLVIEDDHAGDLAEVQLASLAACGPAWAFVRSMSKPYGPDLRLAIVAGDEATIARVEGRMRLGAGWVSTLLQRLVVELWRDDSVAASVRRAAQNYRRRRTALLAALRHRGVPASGRTGINIWIPLQAGGATDEPTAVAALRDRGWAVAPGSHYRLASPPGLRVTVSHLELSDVERMANAVASSLGGSARPARGTTR